MCLYIFTYLLHGFYKWKLLYFELSPPWHLYVLLLANLLAFYLTYLLAFYLAYLLAFYLACYLAFYLAYLLAFYLAVEVQRCSLSSEGPRLRSSGAHCARRVPGWGPAVLTELGGSQVEVQRCSLSSEGPRLRSSGARCAQTLAVEVQQWPLRAEVGEELGEELARRKWTWKWRQKWWRRTRRRRRRRRRRTTLIKSNNPHLAGGEKMKYIGINNCFGGIILEWLLGLFIPFTDLQNEIGMVLSKFIALIPLRDVMANQWGHHVLKLTNYN